MNESTNASIEHLRRWMPWAQRPVPLDDTRMFVRTSYANYLRHVDFNLCIFSNAAGKVLGGTGFHLRDGGLDAGCAEIGMWIRVDAAHRGLGTRVLRELLTWGFNDWPFERLAWRCDPENHASRRVATKCGMQFEGVQRSIICRPNGQRADLEVYAMLKSEWLSANGA